MPIEEKRDLFLKEELQKCIIQVPFKSHSGLSLTWKCDILLNRKYHWNFVRNLRPHHKLAGIELGGFLLAQAYESAAILVRKNSEGYYLFGEHSLWTNGIIKSGDISLIDDVLTTGRSIEDALQLFKNSEFKVKEILCVLDRREHKKDIQGIKVRSLYTNEDFGLPWQ